MSDNRVVRALFISTNLLRAALVTAVIIMFQAAAHAGWLYVLNDDPAGNHIYAFQVDETTGALSPVSGFPMATGGLGRDALICERMAVDQVNNRLWLLDDGSETLRGYSIDTATGQLTQLPYSPLNLGAGTWNSISIHPSGSPVIAANGVTGGGSMSYVVTDTTAALAPGSPFLYGAATAFSSTISADGNYYYVGGNTGANFAGFSIDIQTGVLTALAGSPFASGSNNPVAYASDAQGRLFVVNTGSTASPPPIRVFTTTDGIPTPVTNSPFPSGMTQRRDGLLHPNGNFYFVAGNSGNSVGVFQISGSGADTVLTAVPGSPFPAGGATANVLAINDAGTLLYLANRLSRNITRYTVNTSTGVLTNAIIQPSNTLGSTGALTGMGYIAESAGGSARADFDGDGRTDISVFRDGTWWINRSTDGLAVVNWGLASDVVSPSDFDGDGKTDIAVWRPGSLANFYILQSSDSTFRVEQFGQTGDIVTVGDWDGDGKDDPSVYRNGPQSYFYYRGSLNNPAGNVTYVPWGTTGDIPLRGDYDGDGKQDAAVFRGSGGLHIILQSSSGTAAYYGFGLEGDQPVPADYDGDAKTDVAVFRNGVWYIRRSSTGQIAYIGFGLGSDVPSPGDYDGDGSDDVAVFRPSNGTWHILNSGSGTYSAAPFGASGDVPVPSSYLP